LLCHTCAFTELYFLSSFGCMEKAVVPVLKNDNNEGVSNYRPTAILTGFAKVPELVIFFSYGATAPNVALAYLHETLS
jgi:hypothetical protein